MKGYAIRAAAAKDLLEGAPGDYPVAEAIKKLSGGGMAIWQCFFCRRQLKLVATEVQAKIKPKPKP